MQHSQTPSQATKDILVELSLRPQRFAFIVNREVSDETVKNLYCYNSSLWGGYYNLFVPIDGKTIRQDWLNGLSYHDPDIIFFVGEVLEDTIESLYDRLLPDQMFVWVDDMLENMFNSPANTHLSPLMIDFVLEDIAKQKHLHKAELYYPAGSNEYHPYFAAMAGMWWSESLDTHRS